MRFSQIIKKINLPKINLIYNQKKIFLVSLSALFILLFFLVFLYRSANSRIVLLKNDLILTQRQIQDVERLLTGVHSRNEAIRILKEEQLYSSNKFPQKEEESLRLITEIARKININVISLQPGIKTALLDEAGKQIIIENKGVGYLPITLEVSCSYKDLVKYVLELKTTLPALTSVNRLEIKKEVQLTGKIRASFDFNLYLLN